MKNSLGTFAIGRTLAEGSMARLFVADDEEGTRGVLKVLRDGLGAEYRAQFLREGTILGALPAHRHLVRLLRRGEVAGVDYLFLELVGGPTLTAATQIAPGVIWRDVLSALAQLSAQEIAHGDVAPENLLCHRERGLVLIDFGVAEAPSLLPPRDTVGGTYGYMAPEQARGECITPASDLYNLGLVLLERLRGDAVFPKTQSATCLMEMADGVPDTLWQSLSLPAAQSDLLKRVLAHDAAQRPSAAALLETHADLFD